ncbi:MAG TPA: methyltransferase [Bacteroides sp.]|nr:methyltransferase [Bacteroides sp.]
MNSRQRVLAALDFKSPDRIPVDFGGHRSSGISAIAYARLKKALGITSGNIYVYDMIQQLAIVEEPVLERFQVDTVELGRAYMLEENDWKEWVLPDGTPCRIPGMIRLEEKAGDWYLLSESGIPLGVQKKGSLYFEQIYFPMADRDFENDDFGDLEEQMKRSLWCAVPGPGSHLEPDPEGGRLLAEGAQKLRGSTDRAILGLFGGNLFETPQSLIGMDRYLCYTAMYPDAVLRLSEKLCGIYCREMEKWLAAVGPSIDVMVFGDDLGSNQGPLIDPGMYRLYYQPYHRKMWELARILAPHVKIMLHSCGAIEPFLEDLIEAGLDAVNPVQTSARGMDLPSLKSKYGGRITFWGGGCDTRSVLPGASLEKMETHVRERIRTMKGEGGFVFQAIHNILADVPPEQVIAMFDTVLKYRSSA